MPIVATRPEAAEILVVSVKTIGDWKNEPGFPHRDDNQYDTDAIAAWREATKQQRTKSTQQTEQVNLLTKATRLKILEVKRQSDEMDLELKRGNLMPRELVQQVLGILTTNIKGAINNLQRAGDAPAAQMVLDSLERAKKQINDCIDKAAGDSAK